MREVRPDQWQRVMLEFERDSRNFLLHKHDPAKCRLIVCWRHNWPECPLEVIELRSLIKSLSPDDVTCAKCREREKLESDEADEEDRDHRHREIGLPGDLRNKPLDADKDDR